MLWRASSRQHVFSTLVFQSCRSVHFQFAVTMAITRTASFTSQRKMRIVYLVVGLVLLASPAADAVENSSSIAASARKTSHSSGRHRQQRFLRSRRVQDSLPAPINNELPRPLGSLGTLGILPVMLPENQNAPAPGEASVEESVVPPDYERQGNGGQNNSPPVGAYYGTNSGNAPGLDIPPSVLQSGLLGILPVMIPENQNVNVQVETPVAENTASAPSGESFTQQEAVPAGANSQGGGAPPPTESEGQNIVPPAGNEGRDITPPASGNEGNQIAPATPEGNGGRDKEDDDGYGRNHEDDDHAGTISLTDDKILEEFQEEERKVRTIGGFGIFLAIAAMIFTAWQMSDNPDGIYAAMCRLVITIIGLVMRILLSPCRSCLGGHHGSRNYGGHMPVSTMDYGYRDPALELS